ncbi:substrate-binding domain-containing protein [Glycomyces arizonensis]|uniref:substrate-binding domain-containing protein n=1 Tax=Glycomyces arizonensis TaxID=256035 RepID=UPI0004254113|nr:substrate-binding domain-containing protein [Glycomyces arizonensis]
MSDGAHRDSARTDRPPRPSERRRRLDPTATAVWAGAASAAISVAFNVLSIQAEGLTGTELERIKNLAIILAIPAFGVTTAILWARLSRSPTRITALVDAPPTHRPRPTTLLFITALALNLLGACSGMVALFQPQLLDVFDPPCEDPIELTVAVPQEGAAGFTDVVAEFADDQLDEHGCRTVSVTALPLSWQEVEDAFADDWQGRMRLSLGIRPDVWIAESAAQIDYAGSLMDDDAPLAGEPVPIGTTPLVLAVPQDIESLHTAAETAFASLMQPDDNAVVRADPEQSLTALYHLSWLYELNANDADIEEAITSGLESNGIGKVGDTALLCQLYHRDAATTAVLTTERAVAVYNEEEMGSDCSQTDRPDTQLDALYPIEDVHLDYSALHLGWPDPEGADPAVEADRDRAAEDFIDWLTAPDGQASLADTGIRTDAAETLLARAGGVNTDAAQEAHVLDSGALPGLEARFSEARMPVQVLLAVDNSAAMSQAVGTGQAEDGEDRTLADVALAGAQAALDEFEDDDEFGVWSFPTGEGDPEPDRLLEIGPADEVHRTQAVTTLAALTPEGDTPLYHTIAEGVSVLEGADDERTQPVMVVITGGEDDDPAHDTGVEALTARLNEAGVRLYVVTVAGATCETTGLDEVAEASLGRCESVQAGSLEATFAGVFDEIWGGDDA